MNLLNGKNAGWESERDENGDPVPRVHSYNRKVVVAYLKTWSLVDEDPTLWIGTAKLGTDKYKDQLLTYAAALEADGITEGEMIDIALDALAGGDESDADDADEEAFDDF
jgi:hypothetical protein